MTDAGLRRSLSRLATDARERTFGVRDGSQTQATIRHGYLLCLEELARLLDDHVRLKTTSGPRDDAA